MSASVLFPITTEREGPETNSNSSKRAARSGAAVLINGRPIFNQHDTTPN